MSFCSWDKDEYYKDHFSPGIYVCSKCGYELFSSRNKYEHGSPWPAFSETIHKDSVTKRKDRDMDLAGRPAVKVLCGKCGQGLGHEFFNDRADGKSRF